MYPRAEAYIISVKQSTYCQFGEVIRAHTERGEGERGGPAGWREREHRRVGKKIYIYIYILEREGEV